MSYRTLVVLGSTTSEDCYGVTSGERVVASLRRQGWQVDALHAGNGRQVLRSLLDNPPDLVVPVGFGPPCEDGQIFALARIAGVRCAGPTSAAGAMMQDKSLLPALVSSLFTPYSGIRTPRGYAIDPFSAADEIAAGVASLRLPLVVKPAFGGSSHGLSVERTHGDAIATVARLLPSEGKVVVQELESDVVAEISCTVLDMVDGPEFLPVVEIRRDDVQVLLPEQKFGPDGLDRHIVPARLTEPLVTAVRTAVLALHRAVGAVGLTRTDILIGPNEEIIVLEMNGIPGLLETSIACDAARAAGISFDQLCVQYANSAFLQRAEPTAWARR